MKNILLLLLLVYVVSVFVVYHNKPPHDNNPLRKMYITNIHEYNDAKKYGVDLRASIGTQVFAVANGKVIEVIKNDERKGNGIVIEHTNGDRSRYHHLSMVFVHVNDTVSSGQNIGLSGNSGYTNGPHLHFAIERRNPFRAL